MSSVLQLTFKGLSGSLVLLSLLLSSQSIAKEKRFKRALVLAGGGITQGVGLGAIEGALEVGWKPDVVITTCGSAITAQIQNEYPNPVEAYNFLLSQEHYNIARGVKIQTSSALPLMDKFSELDLSNPKVPDFFNGHVLHADSIDLTHSKKSFDKENIRLIIVAMKAKFGPEAIGTPMSGKKLFKEVFFTDDDTALALKDLKSPVGTNFPSSYIDVDTETITDMSPGDAARASISDPFLINPPLLRDSFYFTGAADLHPVEIAKELADEVIVTYPYLMFKGYEVTTIESSFGFNPNDRALKIIQDKSLNWMDVSGRDYLDLPMDPKVKVLWFVDGIPNTLEKFQKTMTAQWLFGRERMIEAVNNLHSKDKFAHLREPLNTDFSVQLKVDVDMSGSDNRHRFIISPLKEDMAMRNCTVKITPRYSGAKAFDFKHPIIFSGVDFAYNTNRTLKASRNERIFDYHIAISKCMN